MNYKIQYKFNLFFRLVFISLGLIAFLIGFFVDGIKLFGTTTNKGAFKPIKVGIYKSMMDKRFRYRWKVKYEFFINKTKYIGSKFFRGGPDNIDFKKEIGYLAIYPKINWLETDEPKGINLILGFIIGQFFVWFAFRKKLIYSHDLSVVINGVYFNNTGILPVRGLGPLAYISFIFEEIKKGFKRVINIAGGLIGKVFLISFLLYPAIEARYETNYLISQPPKTLSLFGLISSFGAFILGIGASLIFFNFMSSGFCREDSIIGLIMFFICYKAHKNINNPVIGFINSFEKGNPQNPNAARKILLGASLGFLLGFCVIWTSYTYLINYLFASLIFGCGFSIVLISFLFRNNDNSEEMI